jgi:excisionase family DNA binding protein
MPQETIDQPNEPELLSITQGAAETGVPRSTFWLRIVTGELRATKVGRQWVITRADLEVFRTERLAGTAQRRRGWVHGWKE